MEPLVDKKYIIYGEIAIISENKLEITELPIGTWTQTYKESVLEPMLHGVNEKTPPSITYVTIKLCCILQTIRHTKVLEGRFKKKNILYTF